MTIDYRALVELFVLVAVALGAYYKANGFCRSNPGNNKTQMTKDVTETKTRVEILEKSEVVIFQKVDKMADKIEKIADDVSFIKGKMEG